MSRAVPIASAADRDATSCGDDCLWLEQLSKDEMDVRVEPALRCGKKIPRHTCSVQSTLGDVAPQLVGSEEAQAVWQAATLASADVPYAEVCGWKIVWAARQNSASKAGDLAAYPPEHKPEERVSHKLRSLRWVPRH